MMQREMESAKIVLKVGDAIGPCGQWYTWPDIFVSPIPTLNI